MILDQSKSIYSFIEINQELTWTKWIPKLKFFLQPLWNELIGKTAEWADASLKLRSPGGMKDVHVKNSCSQVGVKNMFRTTTIHSVKGETLNAVLLVSHPNKLSPGGHFSPLIKEGNYDT